MEQNVHNSNTFQGDLTLQLPRNNLLSYAIMCFLWPLNTPDAKEKHRATTGPKNGNALILL